MEFEPKPGLVVRYDFLWKEDSVKGLVSGKDRPCAIVLTTAAKTDGSVGVLLCAITHAPPGQGETAVAMPPAVARHLGLDGEPSWVKTDQVNLLQWGKGPHSLWHQPGAQGRVGFRDGPAAARPADF